MLSKDLRTEGIILKRVDYGEADRILSVLTPDGKVSVIARGVRKTRSRLAGGIEMLTLTDLNMHFGKGEIGILTSAQIIISYQEILKDLKALEMAGELIKKASKVADTLNSPELFEILKQGLSGINAGMNISLVEAWFILNARRLMGEEVNLYRDERGNKLDVKGYYNWKVAEAVFERTPLGLYGEMEIKMLRLMAVSPLKLIARVKVETNILNKVIGFTEMFGEL